MDIGLLVQVIAYIRVNSHFGSIYLGDNEASHGWTPNQIQNIYFFVASIFLCAYFIELDLLFTSVLDSCDNKGARLNKMARKEIEGEKKKHQRNPMYFNVLALSSIRFNSE